MKTPINSALEKALLDGCRIIKKSSVNYKLASGDITHILVECPPEYRTEADKDKRPAKFISFEIFDGNWYEAVFYYSNKRYAVSRFAHGVTDDAIDQMRIKENANR